MIAPQPQALHDRRVQEIADEYEHKGYLVVIEPKPDELPDFLHGFRPDLIAESPSDKVVVEVKLGNALRQSDSLEKLAEVIHQHSGWRLELALGGQRKQDQSLEQQSMEPQEIVAQLKAGWELANSKNYNAALLITWAAVEAAMRVASEREEVEVRDFRPSSYVSRLYSDGLLEREEYDLMLYAMQSRNAVAHGYRNGTIDASLLDQLRGIAKRLLQPESNKTNLEGQE